MSKTFIIPVAMLAILGTSGAAFAAQTSDDSGQRHVRHTNHLAAQHRTAATRHGEDSYYNRGEYQPGVMDKFNEVARRAT